MNGDSTVNAANSVEEELKLEKEIVTIQLQLLVEKTATALVQPQRVLNVTRMNVKVCTA